MLKGVSRVKITMGFPCKKLRKIFIGDFHVKLKVSFEFFTKDFPVKTIIWKKFLKRFLWKIEAEVKILKGISLIIEIGIEC